MDRTKRLTRYNYKQGYFTLWHMFFRKCIRLRVHEGVLVTRLTHSLLQRSFHRMSRAYVYSRRLYENMLIVLRGYCFKLCRNALKIMKNKYASRYILKRAFTIREYAYSFRRTFHQVRDEAFMAWRAYAHAATNHKKAVQFRSFFMIAKSFVIWTVSIGKHIHIYIHIHIHIFH